MIDKIFVSIKFGVYKIRVRHAYFGVTSIKVLHKFYNCLSTVE